MVTGTKVSSPSEKRSMLLLIVFLILVVNVSDSGRSGSILLPSSTEEAEVVKKAREGDHACFNVIYQMYYSQIYKHVLRMVGSPEDASDLAAETFFKAWRGLPGLYDMSRFRSWLFSIATHAALDILRVRKVRQPSWEWLSESHTNENAARFEGCVEQRELVGLALKQVAPKPRACLLLQLEGFSQFEIAELVGLGKTSVGTYISMAREQFRRAYHQLENS